MRYFYLLLPLLLFSDFSYSSLSERCPYGYRGESNFYYSGVLADSARCEGYLGDDVTAFSEGLVCAGQKVAKDNEYDLVLSEGVLYASPKIDMSGLVIDYLKKENQ